MPRYNHSVLKLKALSLHICVLTEDGVIRKATHSLEQALGLLHRLKSVTPPVIAVAFSLNIIVFAMALSPIETVAGNSVVTIYADGQEQTVTTDAETVGEILNRVDIEVGEHDLVEPGRDTELGAVFHINVYRAKPYVVVDGQQSQNVMSAYSSSRLIAKNAGFEVYPEDKLQTELIKNFTAYDTVGYKITIDRATPLTVRVDGETLQVRTQAETVADMLQEQEITTDQNDTVKPGAKTEITPNMTVRVTRVGVKTKTVTETIKPDVQTIYDDSKETSWSKVKDPGRPGERVVTYRIVTRGGEVVKKQEIQSVVKQKPKTKVVIRGNKRELFAGTEQFWTALRFCESGGDYTKNTGNGFYGAYQFNISTWQGYVSDQYDNVLPSEAPPAVQDKAAQRLYQARGTSPWPNCP